VRQSSFYTWARQKSQLIVRSRFEDTMFFPRSQAIAGLMVVALAGFVTRIAAPNYFQPSALATVTIGSVYFWAMSGLWVSLVIAFAQGGNVTEYETS
jgi:hypothetical protein